MSSNSSSLKTDEAILFADDEQHEKQQTETWKLLVVDDDQYMHQITRLVLDKFTFQNKSLTILSAYSGIEAQAILSQHSDIAIILLDVVMETPDAGLIFVEYVRETCRNHFAQIILRTGQPGYAPEKEVISKYEINYYANKTELTAQKLFALITSCLRAYNNIMTLEGYRQNLELMVQARVGELREKNAQLIQLNQEKNEFLSITAHDIKNPLSNIKVYAEEIETDYDRLPKNDVVKFARLIRHSSLQMLNLVKDLIDVNRIESGAMPFAFRKMDLLPLVNALIMQYKRRAEEKNIQIKCITDKPNYLIYADEIRVHQILENLISNAVKYSLHHKQVTICLSSHSDKVRCTVADEGPGLSKEDQQKLFGKFTRLTPKPTGNEHSSGLGLFIVKKLTEAQQGQVWCQSTLNQGSQFIVEFNLDTQPITR
ncbi:signal transduction histidine kinase [Beggiatoa alba B18LD]|uniref:histidine kinase n=1 Tax=Beggiatoa alba B18LD TaxID=395493 RepID=I3CDC6_9GAMM|nr:hybrid sensor histidine kinase/response regulator [Beggiatoa alba]EIJ41619.1 signal transduction histidine kinase [Beggiatoa alba B18LD]